MVKQYELGDIAQFNITWLTQTGEEASITSPTITIKEYDYVGNAWNDVVITQVMTNESGSNYYYEFDTSIGSANYDYSVTYNAVVDGLNVLESEDFRVVEQAVLSDVATSTEMNSLHATTIGSINASESTITSAISNTELQLQTDITSSQDNVIGSISASETVITDAITTSQGVITAHVDTFETNITAEVKELRHGNEKITFSYTDTTLNSMVILTKADSASDWTSPTSTKTLYFTYDGSNVSKVGEQ